MPAPPPPEGFALPPPGCGREGSRDKRDAKTQTDQQRKAGDHQRSNGQPILLLGDRQGGCQYGCSGGLCASC